MNNLQVGLSFRPHGACTRHYAELLYMIYSKQKEKFSPLDLDVLLSKLIIFKETNER